MKKTVGLSQKTEQFIDAYNDYAEAIFRHCYFRVFDRELAHDFMQETFTRTWKYILGGTEVQNIRAFLYRVANNVIIDHSRKKKSVSLNSMQEKGFDAKHDTRDSLVSGIDARAMLPKLDRLDEKYRQVVIMRYIDELSPKEIAEILGDEENTVSVRLHRAIQKLRQMEK